MFTRESPGCLQLACEARQENAIGGDRHIFDAFDLLTGADQVLRSFTHERLATCEAQVLDAATCSHFYHAHDLFEGEDLIMFAGFNAASGMQYTQRKLHRSVSEMRR